MKNSKNIQYNGSFSMKIITFAFAEHRAAAPDKP